MKPRGANKREFEAPSATLMWLNLTMPFQHPALLEAAVIGVPDATWGEAVKAIVVVKDGQQVSADELRAFCRQRIAGYKVPRSFDFADALPKTATGKVSKKDLRAPYWVAQSGHGHLTDALLQPPPSIR